MVFLGDNIICDIKRIRCFKNFNQQNLKKFFHQFGVFGGNAMRKLCELFCFVTLVFFRVSIWLKVVYWLFSISEITFDCYTPHW